jgi:hypothetical protein
LSLLACAIVVGRKYGARIDARLFGVHDGGGDNDAPKKPTSEKRVRKVVDRMTTALVHSIWFGTYTMTLTQSLWSGAAQAPLCRCMGTVGRAPAIPYVACLKPFALVCWFSLVALGAAIPFISAESWHRCLLWIWRIASTFAGVSNVLLADWMAKTAVTQIIAGVPVCMLAGYLLRCRVSEFALFVVGSVAHVLFAAARRPAVFFRVAADCGWCILTCIVCTAMLVALSRWRMKRRAAHNKMKLFQDVVRHHPGTIIVAVVSVLATHSPLGQWLLERSNHDVFAFFFATVFVLTVLSYGSNRVDSEFLGGLEGRAVEGGEEDGVDGGTWAGAGSTNQGGKPGYSLQASGLRYARPTLAVCVLVVSRILLGGVILWGTGDVWNPRLIPLMVALLLSLLVVSLYSAALPATLCKLGAMCGVRGGQADCGGGSENNAGLALARNLRLLCRGLQPIHFVTFALLKLLNGGEMFTWHRAALGYQHVSANHWVVLPAFEPWFVDVYCLELIVDVVVASLLEMSFADVLVIGVVSLARFAAVAYPLPSSDVHIVAVGFVHIVMVGGYLWRAKKRLWRVRRGEVGNAVQKTATMVNVWATTKGGQRVRARGGGGSHMKS